MQNKYTIEAGIPVSSTMRRKRSIGYKHRWPLAQLKVGESFFAPVTEFSQKVQDGMDPITHPTNAIIRNHSKLLGIKYKFKSRSVEGGVRVWRIA